MKSINHTPHTTLRCLSLLLPTGSCPCVSDQSCVLTWNKSAVCCDEPACLQLPKSYPTNCQQWHHCAAERLHSSRQPSTTKQNSRARAKMQPRRQTRQQGGGLRERGRNKREGRIKMPIAKLSWKWQKKLLCLAFESITVVWLSSYHSLSVNAVSPISHKRVCVCACVVKRLWSVWLWVSATVFLISPLSLPLLSCLSGLDLSPRSMSLFPRALWRDHRRACRRKQVWNEKGQITREWRSWGGKEWKGERLGQITREGEREETAENNIIGWERERERDDRGRKVGREQGRVPIKLMTSTSKLSTDCSWYTHTLVLVVWEDIALTCIHSSGKINEI